MNRATFRNRVNNALSRLGSWFSREEGVPLDTMFAILDLNGATPVDEAGEKWSGLLCGEKGRCAIEVRHPEFKKPFYLQVVWELIGNRYDVVMYIS